MKVLSRPTSPLSELTSYKDKTKLGTGDFLTGITGVSTLVLLRPSLLLHILSKSCALQELLPFYGVVLLRPLYFSAAAAHATFVVLRPETSLKKSITS